MTELPGMMTAIAITSHGPADVLRPEPRPMPCPDDGSILIKVVAAGVNRPDVLQRLGNYAPPPGASDLPGLEVAGTVVHVGKSVERWSVGDQVTALTAGGGYAEYVALHATNALPIPAGLSLIEAAGLPETFFTVWTNVFQRGGLQAGETFLVHGGSSGIGTTAIQLAKSFGATVFATAGSDDKCEACLRLGADHAINYRSTDYVKEIKSLTDGRGINLILDMVGGDYIDRNYQVAAEEGRIVQIAFLKGSITEVNFARLMLKRLTHTGSTLRPRTIDFKARIARELEARVWPLLEVGTVRPLIDRVYPLAEAAEAHRRMESGVQIGKIILQVE